MWLIIPQTVKGSMFTKNSTNKFKAKRSAFKSALVFLFVTVYVFCLNFKEFAPTGLVSISHSELLSRLGEADSGNYLRLALDLMDFNVSPNNYWIVGLWPPGMATFDFICLLLPGNFVVWVFVATALISALPISLVFHQVVGRRQISLATLLSLIYLAEPNRVWAFTSGIFNSDGIGSSFLLSSSLLLAFGLQDRSKFLDDSKKTDYMLMASGFLLIAALSFRWAYLPIVLGLLIGFSSYLLGLAVANSIKRKRLMTQKNGLIKFLSATGIALIPWTGFVYLYLHPGNPSWSTGDYQWAQRWMSDEFLIKGKATWLVEGGANWGCKINPEKCQILGKEAESGSTNYGEFRDEAIATAISRPLELFALKTPIIFSSFESIAGQPPAKGDNQVGGNIFLGSLLVCAFLTLKRNVSRVFLIYALYIGLALSALYLAHVETRYLLPVWDIGILGLMYNVLNSILSTKSLEEGGRIAR